MQIAEKWLKTWICLSFIFVWTQAARPRFDVSTDMGMVLIPSNAEVDTAIFRLRATDQDADFPLVFEIITTTSPVVRVENLPCTLYNKVCQANVFLTRRLIAGRLHDFVVRVRDSKGDSNSMQATILVTNATTPREKIFPHLPSLIMVPEDAKPEKELDYLLVNSNPWTGKPVYIELWQPKELFKIRQRQVGTQTKGVITLIGELDFETQSMYTLTMYATDPYTEIGKDTRNIAGAHVVVIVQDVQDVPPVFTLAPPLTKINNTVKPGDVILRVHAEDGDKGVPREVTYGLVSEGNPFTSFFNVSETTGEITLARPLEELTQITHVGAPIVLKIVAEEIRSSRDEPPAQATVVELGLLLGEPGNSPPYFESDNYVAWINENAEPGTAIMFSEAYSTIVRDEDIGKAGVFALTLENNNGTFEISPAVGEKVVNFLITVRDNTLIDYEKFKSLRFKIRAQEVGPATNLSASVYVTIFLRDVNDNIPVFDAAIYEVTLSENPSAGTRVAQVHATDADTGIFGKIQYTRIIGDGSEAFDINPDSGVITVSMGSVLDREQTSRMELSIEAKDEEGRGLRGTATLIINLLDVNDNPPIFERGTYEFLLNSELTNFTMPAIIKAYDADAEPPNNVVRYEIIHGNYDDKFQLNDETGELTLREAIGKGRKPRRKRDIQRTNPTFNLRKQFRKARIESLDETINATEMINATNDSSFRDFHLIDNLTEIDLDAQNQSRRRRAEDTPLFILTARAYDLGVPHLSNLAQIRIMRPMSASARTVTFVMPGENPDPTKTAETLATITGSRVVIQEIKPYISESEPGTTADVGKRSVVIARVEHGLPGTIVDVDKIREILAANGFGIISGMDNVGSDHVPRPNFDTTPDYDSNGRSRNTTIDALANEEVTVYKAENKLLTWLLILLALLLLITLITLISCCICPTCPFYMEPRKRRIHSSETLVVHSGGRPKRHLHRKPIKIIGGYNGERKEAWSADPNRQQWQFNRRNTMNPGIASLPGDVAPGQSHAVQEHPSSLHGFETSGYGETKQTAAQQTQPAAQGQQSNQQVGRGDERIYMEDMEGQQNRSYEQAELDSLRRHELERGSDTALRDEVLAARQERIREQHFYRDGNAEVLRLITRGEIENHQKEFRNRARDLYHPNGKDILLQRFIEDQKLRRNQDPRDNYHDNYHEVDLDQSLESHRRPNEPVEILILPERLEMQQQPSYGHRQHQDQMRLIADRNYNYASFKKLDDETEYRIRGIQRVTLRDADTLVGETSRSGENTSRRDGQPHYRVHDAELLRQNALLTRLLLEKEAQHLHVPVIDSSSFLETQSLPGHVAIATQTDRTTSTQTEFFARSRSDNEESEEDPRSRRKAKFKGRIETTEDFKKMKTVWVKTPIPEESRNQSGTRRSAPVRTKIEVMESKKISITPDALNGNSNSTKSGESDGNEDDDDEKILRQIAKQDKTSKPHKILSKTLVCTSKKKVSETRPNDDSTTPSPENKDKKIVAKSKIRKKPEKPQRSKKQDNKSTDSEKNHFMEPSFRVLEREISSIHHKIRQFGDKKLKILKKGSGKKNSEDDNGNGCDMSKYEVTSKQTKKCVSRETSPKKITVEQKSKPNDDDSRAKESRSTKEPQPHTSSSDFEDFGTAKDQAGHFNGKTAQSEIPKMQTRSRSELRRQTHLENSDTKSSSNGNGRSDDSESKMKDSSLSPPDFTSSTSKSPTKQQRYNDNEKLKKQQQDKKSLQSQKVIKRPIKSNGTTTEGKKKATSGVSKTEEERRQAKRDETKSTTSVSTKLTASDEGESRTDMSPARNPMNIDMDKLAQDVRDVVEKEISSLTQAAKDAVNMNKTDNSDVDRRNESPTKSRDMRKSRSAMDDKGQGQSVNGKYKMSKSLEIRERKEHGRQQKGKFKSVDLGSPTKQKPDDAISFIVIENNRTALSAADHSKKYENHVKSSIVMEKSKADNSNGNEHKQLEKILISKDNGVKILSEKTPADDQCLSEVINDLTKTAPDTITETTVIVLSASTEIRKSDDKNDVKMITGNECQNNVANEIDFITGNNIIDQINGTNGHLTRAIEGTEKNTIDKIDDMNKLLTDEMDETKKVIIKAISDMGKIASDQIEGNEKSLLDGTTNSENVLSEKIEMVSKNGELQINYEKITSDKNNDDMNDKKTTEEGTVDLNSDTLTIASTSYLDTTEEESDKKIRNIPSPVNQELIDTSDKKPNETSHKTETSVSIVVTTEKNETIKEGLESKMEQQGSSTQENQMKGESICISSSPPNGTGTRVTTESRQTLKAEIRESRINNGNSSWVDDSNKVVSPSERSKLKQALEAEREGDVQINENKPTSARYSNKANERSDDRTRGRGNGSEKKSGNGGGGGNRATTFPASKQPEAPIFKITNALADDTTVTTMSDEEDEEDSSSASDVSNKTALQTRLYETPRHSISSEGGDTITESTGISKSCVKSDGKARQKWSPMMMESSSSSSATVGNPLLRVQPSGSRESPKSPTIFTLNGIEAPKSAMPGSDETTGLILGKLEFDQAKGRKSPVRVGSNSNCEATTKSTKSTRQTEEFLECSTERSKHHRTNGRPVVVAVKRKEHHHLSTTTDHHYSTTTTTTEHRETTKHKSLSPRRDKHEERTRMTSTNNTSEQKKLDVVRSKQLKPQSSPQKRLRPEEVSPAKTRAEESASPAQSARTEDSTSTTTAKVIDHGKDPEIANARSRYMAWYQQKRSEMERKRKNAPEEESRSRPARRTLARIRKPKPNEDGGKPEDEVKGEKESKDAKQAIDASGPRISRLRIRPLVNVESEQLKAIVRQGRKLRKAEATKSEDDLPVQIFVPDRPAPEQKSEPRHHLLQHSEYKYERTPALPPVPAMPFFLHPPPPPPHPSPEHFQDDLSDCRRLDDDLDSGIAVSMQGGTTRLRHQQLLEKKSVFDIAYNEAAPAQLRSDSSTPPS